MTVAFLPRQMNQMPTAGSENKCIALLNCRVVLEVSCAFLCAGFIYSRSLQKKKSLVYV